MINLITLVLFLSNLLVPYGLNKPREFLRMVFYVDKAHILVKDEPSILAQFKSTIYGSAVKKENDDDDDTVLLQMLNEEDLNSDLDTFVRVTFAGITVSY